MNPVLLQNLSYEDNNNNNNNKSDKPICLICSNPNNASHHFGSTTCLACAAFMRRTVVLKMKYKCKKDNNCLVHFTMRMICRSCRYQRCISSGMKEYLVQKPRTSRIIKGKNENKDVFDKILSNKSNDIKLKERFQNTESPDDDSSVVSSSTFRRGSESNILMLSKGISYHKSSLLTFYIEELRKAQQRRKIFYSDQTILAMFTDIESDNIFSIKELTKYNFKELGKNVRFDYMLSYDYVMEHKKIFPSLSNDDCNVLFKYSFLGFSNMDHVFVTLWSKAHKEGLLAFTNRNALSIYDKSFEYDDTLIPEPLKEKFIYEPNKKIFHQIILPLSEMDLDIEEFVFLKTLTINSLSRCEFSLNGKKILNEITDELVKCLSEHYKSKNIPIDRLGELILFISNFYTTFQMFTENFITIDTFKLFDVDNEIRQTLKFSR